MMVISFSSEKARNYLLKKGRIFTFRKDRRKQFIKLEEKRGKAYVEAVKPALRDWFNEGRCKPKIKDIFIWEVGIFKPEELEPWVPFSGFSSLNEWNHEIRGLNKYLKPEGWLYMVDTEIIETLKSKESEIVVPQINPLLQRSLRN
ncbi:unnamed protein product [marine sediment metagenome]|uniref:Uncharacterized protein n=1 Tax=marine sediment metagenome TaxID=412755 RepID=X1BUH1_9ZZZZ